ncbi:MAG: DNA-protecting protein DprA [Salinivirgaceae bacterium]|nr:MAG: DNA-protecting protein DprA [Salinivirgaceae bacterium]
MDEKVYLLALQLIEGVGPATLRKLVDFAGKPSAVFSLSKKSAKVPRLSDKIVAALKDDTYIQKAEDEILFCEKHNIKVLAYYDADYPKRLQHCKDAPAVLFYQGNVDLNYKKVIGIVGTRNATVYGTSLVEKFIEELAVNHHSVMIVSGLAYGIDVVAHKAAIKNSIPTIGIMGTGSDQIYPSAHRNVAMQMMKNGGIITEFSKGTKPDRGNFVTRNRIIAGMCDAIIVAESAERGGSLITADMAFSYNRDVFAFPGKVGDSSSAGCNKLIKMQKAALIESVADIEYAMNWAPESQTKEPVQTSLFEGLMPDERAILELIILDETVSVDYLAAKLSLPMSQLNGILLNLELKNIIKSLPGNLYTKSL